jgi:hypothetical protein
VTGTPATVNAISPTFMSGRLTRQEYTSASPGTSFFVTGVICMGTGAPRKVTSCGPRLAVSTLTG